MQQGNDKSAASESRIVASIVPNLSSLGCGVLAATRIEMYSKRDGNSELEATFYACAEHTVPVVEAVEETGLTTHQMALGEDPYRAKCGAGFNFNAARRALPADEKGYSLVSTPAPASSQVQVDVFGDDHPTIKAAVLAICHDDLTLLPYTRRGLAERILDEWPHGVELSDRERAAVLAQFPEVAKRADEEPEPEEKPTSFNALVEAYRLGELYGRRVSQETLELLARLDARLRDAAEGHQKAYAKGYADGINAAMVDGRVHAFTVTADDEVPDKFRWLCGCRWVTYQYPAGTEQTPIQQRLMEHVAQATAVDARTARAFDTDTCSCPPEVGDHRHLLYIRHPISGGKVHEIVVDSLWLGERRELLCWPLSVQGVALAARWVGQYAAQWDDGSPVVAEDLRRRAARWLR